METLSATRCPNSVNEKALLRKIDLRVAPILFILRPIYSFRNTFQYSYETFEAACMTYVSVSASSLGTPLIDYSIWMHDRVWCRGVFPRLRYEIASTSERLNR